MLVFFVFLHAITREGKGGRLREGGGEGLGEGKGLREGERRDSELGGELGGDGGGSEGRAGEGIGECGGDGGVEIRVGVLREVEEGRREHGIFVQWAGLAQRGEIGGGKGEGAQSQASRAEGGDGRRGFRCVGDRQRRCESLLECRGLNINERSREVGGEGLLGDVGGREGGLPAIGRDSRGEKWLRGRQGLRCAGNAE